MSANALLEKSLKELVVRMEGLAVDHSGAMQPICDALAAIKDRDVEANDFRRNIKDLATAVIEVRTKFGAPSSFCELPIPPYDLWLPFKAKDLTTSDADDLTEAVRIFKDFNHMVDESAFNCADPACVDENEAP